jgi:DNA polymerase-4/DNA polymerase V
MDGDAFFVGCEVAKNPKLKGLPVVTGQERGIVSALSYEAKALGITRGMPIYRVKKNFPQVIIMPGDYVSYVYYSEKMFDIVRRYADDVEEYSIDECFADLTGLHKPLYMTYRQIAERIKKEVTEELGLSVSVGLAPTKVLAKVASKWKKPDGLTVIEPEKISEYLLQTKIENIWGIGPRTGEHLQRRGIKTAGDFAGKDMTWVKNNFSKPYIEIWLELNGVCVNQVDPKPKTEYSSVQKTRSFHPFTNDKVFLLSQISKHTEEACRKARYYSLVPKKFSFFLKSKEFKYYSHTVVLQSPTNAPETLVGLVKFHLNKVWRANVLYRTTGVTLHELEPEDVKQGDLFGATQRETKFETIHKQIDSLEAKFGKGVVHLGSTHKAIKNKTLGTDSDDLSRDLLFL